MRALHATYDSVSARSRAEGLATSLCELQPSARGRLRAADVCDVEPCTFVLLSHGQQLAKRTHGQTRIAGLRQAKLRAADVCDVEPCTFVRLSHGQQLAKRTHERMRAAGLRVAKLRPAALACDFRTARSRAEVHRAFRRVAALRLEAAAAHRRLLCRAMRLAPPHDCPPSHRRAHGPNKTENPPRRHACGGNIYFQTVDEPDHPGLSK